MVDLKAKSPLSGCKPVTHGDAHLRELAVSRITSVAPFAAKEAAVSAALKKALGAGLPEVGRVWTGAKSSGEVAEIMWVGQGQYFVLNGAVPLVQAAVSDQTDAWAVATLEGAGAADVMARLCPLDVRAMEDGDVARSLIGHMTAVIVARSDGYDLMVFRSMAKTLVHEVEAAMRAVAARGRLP